MSVEKLNCQLLKTGGISYGAKSLGYGKDELR